MAREMSEELGVRVEVLRPYGELEHDYEDFTVRLLFFLLRRLEGDPAPLEHQAIAWVTPAELPDFDDLPADRPVLARLMSEQLSALCGEAG